jgi:iron complex outermembrane receptor protein
MRYIIFLVTSFLLAMACQAQSGGSISGSIQESSSRKLEAATISLLSARDSSVIKLTTSDKSGHFSFELIPAGYYLLSVTSVGHMKSLTRLPELKNDGKLVLEPVSLVLQDKSMGNVMVTAKRPLVEQKIDRTIVNVEAAVTNTGSSALEVLEKSPGISVDKEGNISLKGKQGVMVMIDGRPTQLSGADLANLLRNMTAAQLDQIEIMTNPPAKYDAAGNSGIINIKTKKNKMFGYNGTASLNYGQGRYPKINEGINFNYREGKVNLFTNLSHSFRRGFQELDIQRNFREPDYQATAFLL